MQNEFLEAAAIAGGLAAAATLAERRRARRRHLDHVGWMPWAGISFAASFAAILLFAYGLNG